MEARPSESFSSQAQKRASKNAQLLKSYTTQSHVKSFQERVSECERDFYFDCYSVLLPFYGSFRYLLMLLDLLRLELVYK